jgi:ubiquitin carboxyl-terminal hydrolase 1
LPPIQRLLGTREQQDAHELFLVLAEAISVESVRVAREVARSRGMGEVLDLQGWAAGKNSGAKGAVRGRADVLGAAKDRKRQRGLAQPWEGLMARRRVCRVCGWCEAVRMEPVGGMELSLPQVVSPGLASKISLEADVPRGTFRSTPVSRNISLRSCSRE